MISFMYTYVCFCVSTEDLLISLVLVTPVGIVTRYSQVRPTHPHTLIKKKIKFSSYIRKFRMEQLQSHIWLTAPHMWGNICAFPHILGSPSSNMTLQLLHSEFPYIFYFTSVYTLGSDPKMKDLKATQSLHRFWVKVLDVSSLQNE